MSDGYLQVSREYVREEEIRKSRFITTLMPIDGADDAQDKLNIVKKRYADATHNCYAYIADEHAAQMRFGDDGEPQGTAGMPMLAALRKRGVCKTLAVVTRYFGGVKLGASGLVGAYSSGVTQALDRAPLADCRKARIAEIVCDYASFGKAEETIARCDGRIVERTFGNETVLRAAVACDKCDRLAAQIADATLGKAKIAFSQPRYFAFEIINSGE